MMYDLSKSETIVNSFKNEDDLDFFKLSIINDDVHLFSSIIKEYNINPKSDFSILLFHSLELKKYNIVYYLLKNNLVNPETRSNLALRLATFQDNFELVKYIDSFEKTNATDANYKVLLLACNNNNSDMINYFFTHYKMKADVDFYACFILAAEFDNLDIFKTLFTHLNKVDNSILVNNVLSVAIKHKSFNVLNYIIQHDLNYPYMDKKAFKLIDSAKQLSIKKSVDNF